MVIGHLRVLGMKEPLGIDIAPAFSWELHEGDPNTLQTTYRIIVRKQSTGNVVWDSGTVESSDNAYIPYDGSALEGKTPYEWTVTVEDNHRNVAQGSSVFETAMLHTEEWMSAWAESTLKVPKRKKGFGNQCPATYFRKSFTLDAVPRSARLYATCRGAYRLTVNGKRADTRELAPEYSSYEKVLYYQTYDVTNLLVAGKNVIGMCVADGWWFCPTTAISKKTAKGHHAVLFQLELHGEDGALGLVTSMDDVKTSYGPILSSDLFAGEQYDARKELRGWDLPEFDDSSWGLTKPAALGFKNLRAQIGDPVRPVRELPAVRTYVSPKGEHIVDFGENVAGRVRMHVNAPKDTVITLEHFEVCDPEGNAYNNILGAAGIGGGVDQRVEYVSNGRAATYEESFSYQGFRFVRVIGLDLVRPEDFTAVVLSSSSEDIGSFSCSSDELNQLYANVRHSQTANLLSIPTDCPQREKAGWTGDIGIYARTALQNSDVSAFLMRWLQSVSADQAKNGSVPMVVPYNQQYRGTSLIMGITSGTFGDFGVSGWGDAAVIVPWTMYEVTGNLEVLRSQYSSMTAWCDYIISAAKKRGDKSLPREHEQHLWNTGFHYGEWLIPSTSRDGFDFKTMGSLLKETASYTVPAYSYRTLEMMARIAQVLGRDEDARTYSTEAQKVKAAIQACIIRDDGTVASDRMGAYAILLAFGLVPEELRGKTVNRLAMLIHENGDRLDTGFLATPFLLDALWENGERDLAWTLLMQPEAPSWLYEVRNGATTIWESWYGYKEDGTPADVSMNHYAFGCVADWMFKVIGGIRQDDPGFRHLTIAPVPGAGIVSAQRSFRTSNGWASASWSSDEDAFKLSVTIPCNARATVILPNGDSHEVGSGTYEFSCER